METVSLLVPDRADYPLADLVETALRQRAHCRVRVVDVAEFARAGGCHALVSTAPAGPIGSLLESLHRDAPGRRALPVLIHPRPSAEHYKLALRSGIEDVIVWPDEFPQWHPYCGSRDPAEPLRGLALDDELRRRISRIASFDCNVLLIGETGCGKERVAGAIHALSPRRHKPLVTINCAALPDNLVESELFGYDRGAFTGAYSSQAGKLEAAQGGTLFLDEIGDMPAAAQAKILRMVEGHEYFRLGGVRPVTADVRLIAATHQDLEGMCGRGAFRSDLYFRLDVARIVVPPLRERPEEIMPLAERFVAECCRLARQPQKRLSSEARETLRGYSWPGNVRELRNAIETAIIDAEGMTIEAADLPARVTRWVGTAPPGTDERTLLVSVLERTRWNKSSAARELHWSRMKLYRKLHQYRLDDSKQRDRSSSRV